MKNNESFENHAFTDIGEAHKRGIAITLATLDEALCEIEQWAMGRAISSIFYKERNTLTSRQRQKILLEVKQMKNLLQELQQSLPLEPSTQDAKSAIRSKCAWLWEHLVELKSEHLRRYGETPEKLAEYLDPKTERLIEGLLHILDALKSQKP
ncbi:MAG: hypothetical protein QME62_11775 [Armatimonadota bacterium]|nr:hypothetical protein [Armatimonadota bacterium]